MWATSIGSVSHLAQMGHQPLKLHDIPVRDMTQPLATLSHSGLYRCATLIIRGDSKSLEINHGYNLIVMYLFILKVQQGSTRPGKP